MGVTEQAFIKQNKVDAAVLLGVLIIGFCFASSIVYLYYDDTWKQGLVLLIIF